MAQHKPPAAPAPPTSVRYGRDEEDDDSPSSTSFDIGAFGDSADSGFFGGGGDSGGGGASGDW